MAYATGGGRNKGKALAMGKAKTGRGAKQVRSNKGGAVRGQQRAAAVKKLNAARKGKGSKPASGGKGAGRGRPTAPVKRGRGANAPFLRTHS